MQDLTKQSGADRLSSMHGDGSHTAVWMTQSMVASLNANYLEAQATQRANQLFACEALSP
jgi:hypothetical protein